MRASCPVGVRERLEGSAIGLVFPAFMPGLAKNVPAARADAPSPDIGQEIFRVGTTGFALDPENCESGLTCAGVRQRPGPSSRQRWSS
ncbi:IclR family transcriptional regulator [Paenirhodobacter populi]|uniref:Uncharacterized protein n=1 Tax=Paenirhodobacter populi TaxID=2306993 RepID=A0A443IYS0_9RHOB|nr:hypothetical protein [Sinirhodobacter populi]RWR13315.1 hypothetical protein D2T33_06270 [Sinirhodobacter populi]